MATVTLKGNTVNLTGDLPSINTKAIDFKFVKEDLSEGKLSDYAGKVRVVLAVPSIDTGVCAIETTKFNQELKKRSDVTGIVVSMDLPFAFKRFCAAEGIENVVTGSEFRYKDFMTKYNTELIDGGLAGVSARAVFVIDREDTITYAELVPEITEEPDYSKALAAIDSLL